MYKNFLITASGRSGTRFLSFNMNKSDIWTVRHERTQRSLDLDPRNIVSIQQRFNRDYYGEVNSWMRWNACRLKVAMGGVIFREPISVWISWANRRHPRSWPSTLSDMEKTFDALIDLVDNHGYLLISFRSMVTDLDYLRWLFRHFLIEDVVVDSLMVKTKINITRRPRGNYKSISEFDRNIQDRVLILTEKIKKWRQNVI